MSSYLWRILWKTISHEMANAMKRIGISLLVMCLILGSGCDSAFFSQNSSEIDLDQFSGFDVEIAGKATDSTFFPLQPGTNWRYELVYSDVDPEQLPFPEAFVTSVEAVHTIDGMDYYVVNNYFLPSASPEIDVRDRHSADEMEYPMLLRFSDNQVYLLIEDEEQLFYSFSEDLSKWNVNMYAGEFRSVVTARLEVYQDDNAAIGWDYPGFMGSESYPSRAEAGWGDVFERGIGRVRIVSGSQGYGEIVWDLQEVRFPE